MKNSGVEWIGEIPDEWEVRKIKYFQDQSQNNSFVDGDWIESSDISTEGIRYLTTGNIGDGSFKEQGNGYISKETFDNLNCKYAYPGDLIFSRLNSPYGRTCILPNNYPEYVIAVDNVILRTKENCNFLNFVTQCDLYQNTTEELAKGSTMKRISRTKLGNIKLPLPPKETQQKIASYLDSKCSKIEETIRNQQQVIEKLKAYKQSLITEAVTGKIKIQNGQASGTYESYKDSGVEWIGKIPSEWKPIKAKYFVKISNGSDPKTEEGDTPVYGSGAESFKTCVEFKEGPTVLIGRKGATLHIPHYIEGNYWNVDTAFDVKTYSEEAFLLKFYYYCATAFDYKFYLTSTTLPSMTQTNYGNMYLPVPNTQTQKEIVEFLNNKCTAIDTAIEQKQKLIEKLTEYKKSLIYECVTGKKEI